MLLPPFHGRLILDRQKDRPSAHAVTKSNEHYRSYDHNQVTSGSLHDPHSAPQFFIIPRYRNLAVATISLVPMGLRAHDRRDFFSSPVTWNVALLRGINSTRTEDVGDKKRLGPVFHGH
jgi:hypothetical protein